MHTFHITYRAVRGDAKQAQRIMATDASEAIDLLRKQRPVHSIVNVAMQCVATTRSGTACQHYGPDTLCAAHDPRRGGL